MMIRIPRCFLMPMLVCAVALVDAADACAQPEKPNVVVIVADDLGYGDLGFTGARDIATPHLDALARSSATFSNAYVSAPVCLPSRMGLLTGIYQQRFGIQTLAGPGKYKDVGLPVGQRTLGDFLLRAGYATGVVGKWHVGEAEPCLPNRRGFDEFYGFLEGGLPYKPNKPGVIWRNTQKVAKTEYLTDVFGTEAVDFVRRHHDKPFFLYLAFNAVHLPLEAMPRDLADYEHITDPKRRTYAAMLSAMDRNIGRVMTALREHRLEENTMVFFLSDNGGLPQMWCHNDPLRGGKYQLFEGGTRTPFFVRWPAGGISAGAHDKVIVSALDIVPTVLSAVGLRSANGTAFDGIDLLPVLRGKTETVSRTRLFWRYGPYMCAMREGDWKLVKNGIGENMRPEWELYRLSDDVGEKHNLASAMPKKVAELAARFEEWDASLPPPLFVDQRLLDGVVWWQK